ncbi:MAG: hypothetical protein IK108_03500 [Clostridia bacterium]|nr:hypothetical protein [Clostridia bacterium]
MHHMKAAVAVLLILALITLGACGSKKTPEEPSSTQSTSESTLPVTESAASVTATSAADNTTAVTSVADTTLTTAAISTTAPATTAEATSAATSATAASGSDFSSFDKAQTLNFLAAAINKTKAYTGDITVHHKESFTSTVTNVKPGGALATRALNFIKDLVLKPTEEDYRFSGGTATTSEGETTQLLLPKAAAFTLPEEGVAAASISQEGDLVHVILTLAAEEVRSLSEVPKYNAASIGYLDIAGSFSILQIDEVTIRYPGSVIDAYVRGDGYVDRVTYTIKLDAGGKAHAMGISGSADFNGDQVEIWEIKW